MKDIIMDDDTKTSRPNPGVHARRGLPRIAVLAAALFAAAAIGAGTTAVASRGHHVELVALTPQPITALRDGTSSAIKGNVAEVFGNKFVIDDGSGRALVETGKRGERVALVANGETVTAQGRFEHGFFHAAAITHADGHTDMLDAPPPPHDGPVDARPDHGPKPPL